MPFSMIERNASIDETAARMSHLTLFAGDPEAGGAEIAGVVRVTVPGWTEAKDGVRSITGTVDIKVPAGSTFDHIVLMDGDTAGTVRGYVPVPQSSFGSEGTYTVSTATISFPAS